MRIKPFLSAPPKSMILVALVFFSILLNREALLTESLPIFLSYEQNIIYVEMEGHGLTPGVYQFNDGSSPLDVIKLTNPLLLENIDLDPRWHKPLQDGESLRMVKKDRETSVLHRSWMKASHRLSMEIPLHPDRMSLGDWTVLPGVGIALAERIENDRQKNGDFGFLDALIRVKGIGEKRVNSWRGYFEDV